MSAFHDELLRERSDRHKPTFRQLRDEGLSQPAIELLHEGRDMLELGWPVYDFAKWLDRDARTLPQADVWPDGKPDHWAAWDEQRYGMPDDYDPTDAELERSWNGPDAHEAHRAAWALHQETRSA